MEEARGWGDIGAGRSPAASKRRALLDPSPHPPPEEKPEAFGRRATNPIT